MDEKSDNLDPILWLEKLAPKGKVGAYMQSWRLHAKLAPTCKVGAYMQVGA
jgi:hypothetical protein